MYSWCKGASVMISNPVGKVSVVPDRQQALKEELAGRIAAYVGAEQKRITEVPGLTVHR